ncbi:ankyrin, partial [Lepidopterella palustris CBS 459.81]
MKLLLKQDEISPASKNQALLKAAENGREGIVKLLVEQDDVDINSKDGVGKTPLSWAAKKGRTEVVRLLLTESGININSKDGAGKTPLSWAAEEGHTE